MVAPASVFSTFFLGASYAGRDAVFVAALFTARFVGAGARGMTGTK